MLSKKIKPYIFSFILAFICLVINIFCSNSERVENLYSSSYYITFAKNYRAIFAWIPFSVGDVLYTLVGIFILVKLLVFAKTIFSKNKRPLFFTNWKTKLFKLFNILAIVYIVFNLLWGINYNRNGIATQLDLKIEKYTIDDLKNINNLLVQKINEYKLLTTSINKLNISTDSIFENTKVAFDSASKKYAYLKYENTSIKKSMYSWFCNYSQIYGYYNPFTAEANINYTVPNFTQPFTTCHEVAHQLGYAKEMEANFVGYLVATNSNNNYFKYSTYSDLFSYANTTLFFADTSAALEFRKMLITDAIKDFKEKRKFAKDHVGAIEPIIKFIYGKYLEQNEQPLGILSYDEVTAFLIAYYKKFGDI